MEASEGVQPPVLDVSVVIPTIGRPEQLRTTLESLAACRPRAAEIVVVDQSGDGMVGGAVAEFAAAGAVRVRSTGRGIGLAVNEGLGRAQNEIVLGTHDDCSVAEDWVAVGHRLASSAPSCIFTGRVRPLGDPQAIPSTKDDPRPHDFTGELTCQVLYPSNMVLPRTQVLDFGAFDERFETAAEDNDLCYRWLRAGRCLRYEPSLVVQHRDWRTPDELRQLHVRYWRGHGRFYAKHLRRGDRKVLRFLVEDLRYAADVVRALFSALARQQRPLVPDEHRVFLRGFVPGLLSGWRDFRK
jgi:GT2 family glycosyltransferase